MQPAVVIADLFACGRYGSLRTYRPTMIAMALKLPPMPLSDGILLPNEFNFNYTLPLYFSSCLSMFSG